eukprot:9467004-Pyramimonas_sp.AAC.1
MRGALEPRRRRLRGRLLLAPAVNRKPGHRREPRRAPSTRKSAEHQKRGLLEALLGKEETSFFSCRHKDGSSKCFD